MTVGGGLAGNVLELRGPPGSGGGGGGPPPPKPGIGGGGGGGGGPDILCTGRLGTSQVSYGSTW